MKMKLKVKRWNKKMIKLSFKKKCDLIIDFKSFCSKKKKFQIQIFLFKNIINLKLLFYFKLNI